MKTFRTYIKESTIDEQTKEYHLNKSGEHALAVRQAKSSGNAKKANINRVLQKKHWDQAEKMGAVNENDSKNTKNTNVGEFLKKRKERIAKSDGARMRDPFNKKYFGKRKEVAEATNWDSMSVSELMQTLARFENDPKRAKENLQKIKEMKKSLAKRK